MHAVILSAYGTAVLLQSFVSDMQRLTRRHTTMKCYGLGLGLDTFRIVSLGENFRRLDPITLMNTYSRFVAAVSQEATDHGILQQLALWSNRMWLITCTGCQHWCIAHPVLMPYPSNMPFSPLSVDPPASACTASLGQAGQRVCLRPSFLYMLASLSVSDTTVSTAALCHAMSYPNMVLLFMQGKQATAFAGL